jgi:hypothetical protein
MKTSITRLALSLILLPACLITPQDPANVALSSSSGDLDSSSGDTGVFTSTDGGTSTSGEDSSAGGTSTSGEDSSADDSSSSTSTGADLPLSSNSSGNSTSGEGSSSTGVPTPSACRPDDYEAVCRVFVSSGATVPSLGAAGLHGLCTDLACNADPSAGECRPYRALVRTTDGFFEPFASVTGHYLLPSGAAVAQGVDGLQDSLPINEDETGAVVGPKEAVWTGAAGLYSTCPAGSDVWGTDAADMWATIGYVDGAESTWYEAGAMTCDNAARVYCVEVPAL